MTPGMPTLNARLPSAAPVLLTGRAYDAAQHPQTRPHAVAADRRVLRPRPFVSRPLLNSVAASWRLTPPVVESLPNGGRHHGTTCTRTRADARRGARAGGERANGRCGT